MNANTILAMLGRKGSGKSTLVGEIVREFGRVLIVDSMNEYGRNVGAEVVYGFEGAVRAIARASRRTSFRISFRGLEVDEALIVARGVFTLRNVLFVLEEASLYMKAQQIPPDLAKLVRTGRHRGISQLYVAQRPSMLHLDVISQADVIVSFQQHARRDVDTLTGHLGDMAERVRELDRFELIAGGPEGWEEKAPLAVLARVLSDPKKSLARPEGQA